MENHNFKLTVTFKQAPAAVFKAILNPRAWWSEEIAGFTENAGDIFDYHYEDIHSCKIKLAQVIPDKRVVWRVLENYFKPGIFELKAGDKTEWVNTNVIFDISQKDGMTELVFTHEGLVPEYDCYDICVNGWTHYIKTSIYNLITTGVGHPNATEKPMTADEERIKAALSN